MCIILILIPFPNLEGSIGKSHNGVTHLRRATTREIASDHQRTRPAHIRIPVFVRYGGDDGAPLRGHHQPKSAPVCVAVRTAEPGRYTLACYLEIPSLRCRSHCHERSELFLSLSLLLPNDELLSAVRTADSHLSAFLHLTCLPAMIILCRRIRASIVICKRYPGIAELLSETLAERIRLTPAPL